MTEAATTFLLDLARNPKGREHYAAIDRFAVAGDIDTLVQVAEALDIGVHKRVDGDTRRWLCDQIEYRLLRIAGRQSAEAIIRLAAFRESLAFSSNYVASGPWRQPYLASLLTQYHDAAPLVTLFPKPGVSPATRELFTCLVQEIVVRSLYSGQFEIAAFQQAFVTGTNHPLAWLPLYLLPVEERLSSYLPILASADGPRGIPYPFQHERPSPPFNRSGITAARPLVVVNQIQPSPQATAAVDNWIEDSNGKIENACFRFNRTVENWEVGGKLLLDLKLECVEGVEASELGIANIYFAEALGSLFATAANGGAYNNGHFAAFGRLEAWRSVAALSGAPVRASIQDIAAHAERCDWFLFAITGDWFYDVTWDLAIGVLRPDRVTFAFLAATDTD